MEPKQALWATMTIMLFAAAGPACGAERHGAFVGGGVGWGSFDIASDFPYYVDPATDDDMLLLEAHGGYRFNRYFAVEGMLLGAANGGDYDDNDASFGALSARAVGFVPLGDVVEIFGLAGLYFGGSEVGLSGNEDEGGLVVGGGLQANFGSRGQFGLRLDYEYYVGDKLVDSVSGTIASFQYNFFP